MNSVATVGDAFSVTVTFGNSVHRQIGNGEHFSQVTHHIVSYGGYRLPGLLAAALSLIRYRVLVTLMWGFMNERNGDTRE